MEFTDWEPVYEAILAAFGYDRQADEHARDLLVELLAGHSVCDPDALDLEGQVVAIAGPGSSLQAEMDVLSAADRVIAVGTASEMLEGMEVSCDCLVTDLDTNPALARKLSRAGTPVVVHAHGDNQELLREYVPTLAHNVVIPTTQSAPRGPVQNFGGFTDGDRAAFLADAFGATQLQFPGWALSDPTVGGEKRQKLTWAARLLYWLEHRRGEEFALLDGLRDDIEPVWE